MAQICRRLGVSRKALRLYESRGLISPERTPSEWRIYGPEQIARLHQILALRHFGFSIGRVAEILNGDVPDLSRLLAIHETLVTAELASLQRAADLLKAARTRLAVKGALSTDDLIFLTKETIMNEKRPEDLSEIYDDIAARHLSAGDRAALSRDGVPVLLRADAEWPQLHEEAQRLMDSGDPTSIESMDLARRWMEKVFQTTGGDPRLTQKLRAVARDLHDNASFQEASTSSNAMMDFVQKAYGAAIAAGLMPKP